MMKTYNLVHITTGGEYQTPLVQSQLFDQAEAQAKDKKGFAPKHVQAWIIAPLREAFDKKAQDKVRSLRKRCPNIKISMFNGVDRLAKAPIIQSLCLRRLMMGGTPVVYHCRGEQAAQWAIRLKRRFPKDKVVLDVRGYWPAELLYKRGIEYIDQAAGVDRSDFDRTNEELRNAISGADGVTTVSEALRELLVTQLGAPQNTIVVQCCVSGITDDSRRAAIRQRWGIKDSDIAVVYSGTTAKYQHLDDLTLPFLKKLVDRNTDIRLVMLSPEIDKIKEMLVQVGIYTGTVVLENVPQNEVAATLTACDAGVLIRKPTLVNIVANPVKIAEYFASGLPIIVEEGVGGIPKRLYDDKLVMGIQISNPAADQNQYAAAVEAWLESGLAPKRQAIREEVQQNLLWSSAIHISRGLYARLLG